MQEIQEREFINAIKNNQISPYQVYNFDLDYTSIFSTNYYLNHKLDNITKEQKLNILFFDIEVFTNNSKEFPAPSIAKYPIVSNTIYSSFQKCYEAYFMLMGENLNLFPVNNTKELEKKFKDYLVSNGYMEKDESIKINICQSENEIILNSWRRIHEIDPAILSGFNADKFDLPYIYNRLMNLTNNNKEQVQSILSKFNNINVRNYGKSQIIQIPEYPLADIRHLYIPRSEGGANYGKTRASYTLDWISDAELKLKKLEYKNSGMSIDDFYIKDPVNYLLYNIIDVILVNKLNQKLQHIELHNMLRRIMCVPFSASLRGSSVLFDNFVFSIK
jgi:DNA polymerase elongation subunit (family B)